MKSISIKAYVNTMIEKKVRQSHYVRCFQDTSRARNMEVRYVAPRPRNAVDAVAKKSCYQKVTQCDASEESEEPSSGRDSHDSLSSPESRSPPSRACCPLSPRPLLPSAPTHAHIPGPRRAAAAASTAAAPYLPCPLPRTALCGVQEPWEHEMLRLPARLFEYEAAASARQAAMVSALGFSCGLPHPMSGAIHNGGGVGAWRERCVGDVKLLRGERQPRSVRVLMRRQDKTKAPCANHLVTIDMELRPAAAAGLTSAGERAWVYHVLADYAEGCPESRVIALQFQSGRAARRWRTKFDEARHMLETECDA